MSKVNWYEQKTENNINLNGIEEKKFSKKEVLDILYDKDTSEIYNKFLEIENSIEHSKDLYEYFDELINMLLNKKSSIRVRAFRIICRLSKWDKDNKINNCIDVLLKELFDDKPTAVRQCLSSLNILLQYKPELFKIIEKNLKNIELNKYKDSMSTLIERDIEKLLESQK